MQIVWDHNPLKTRVYLTDQEKDILLLKVQKEELLEIVSHTYFILSDKATASIMKTDAYKKEVLEDISYESLYGKAVKYKEEAKRMFGYYIDALEKEEHSGDCTCSPFSCIKCHAETLIGIDTIKGLSKYSALKIQGAFALHNDIDKALNHLNTYRAHLDANPPWEGWESYADRWETEAKTAAYWLSKYKAMVDEYEYTGRAELVFAESS